MINVRDCIYCVPINGQHAPGCPVLKRGGGLRRVAVAAVAVLAAVVLSACGARAVDVEATGAQPVPGMGTLHWVCHGPTLIYVTIVPNSTEDDYEWFYPGGCVPADLDGNPETPNPAGAEVPWVMNFAAPDYMPPVGDSTELGDDD